MANASDSIGYNLFVYCDNNPIRYYDPSGHSIKSIIKSIFSDFLDPCVEQTKTVWPELVPGTFAVGKSVSGAFGWRLVFSKGIAIDSLGNVSYFVSKSLGGGTPSASGSVFVSFTSAPTTEKFGGKSYQIGGSVPIAGYERVFFQDSNDLSTYYTGNTFAIGETLSSWMLVELHAEIASTDIIETRNIFNQYSIISQKVQNW